MKQVVLKIPDDKYLAFLKFIRSKFSDIQIKEENLNKGEVNEDESSYETMLLSEKSLAEDWLSDEDSKWDEVL